MKRYILDTGFFVIIRNYYSDIFPSFWEKLSNLSNNHIISSVDEVFSEIDNYGGKQEHLMQWIRENKKLFTQPTIEEQEKVREILNQEFTLISKKNMMSSKPFADPFVIAKAKAINGIVVTGERPAKKNKNGQITGKYKIPDVCDFFKIPWILPEDFMQAQQWKF